MGKAETYEIVGGHFVYHHGQNGDDQFALLDPLEREVLLILAQDEQ